MTDCCNQPEDITFEKAENHNFHLKNEAVHHQHNKIEPSDSILLLLILCAAYGCE